MSMLRTSFTIPRFLCSSLNGAAILTSSNISKRLLVKTFGCGTKSLRRFASSASNIDCNVDGGSNIKKKALMTGNIFELPQDLSSIDVPTEKDLLASTEEKLKKVDNIFSPTPVSKYVGHRVVLGPKDCGKSSLAMQYVKYGRRTEEEAAKDAKGGIVYLNGINKFLDELLIRLYYPEKKLLSATVYYSVDGEAMCKLFLHALDQLTLDAVEYKKKTQCIPVLILGDDVLLGRLVKYDYTLENTNSLDDKFEFYLLQSFLHRLDYWQKEALVRVVLLTHPDRYLGIAPRRSGSLPSRFQGYISNPSSPSMMIELPGFTKEEKDQIILQQLLLTAACHDDGKAIYEAISPLLQLYFSSITNENNLTENNPWWSDLITGLKSKEYQGTSVQEQVTAIRELLVQTALVGDGKSYLKQYE